MVQDLDPQSPGMSCVLYSRVVMALEFLLTSPGFNSFLLLRDEQNSKCVCVGGGVLAVIKCIYLPPTHLHFIQDIEDRCLLLTSIDVSYAAP
jgi:hypothetical protein